MTVARWAEGIEAEKPTIDPDFEEATEGEEIERKERLKTKWAQLEAIVEESEISSPRTVSSKSPKTSSTTSSRQAQVRLEGAGDGSKGPTGQRRGGCCRRVGATGLLRVDPGGTGEGRREPVGHRGML